MKKAFATGISAFAMSALPLATPAQTIATVNGKTITQAELNEFVQVFLARGARDSLELREQAKQELIQRQIALQVAEKAGLEKKDSVQKELERAREAVLLRALMAEHLEKHSVTDQQLQAEYDKLKEAQKDRKEYKVRHILVRDKEKALALVKEIQDKKVSFGNAATRDSVDETSAKSGGELGWLPASNFIPVVAQVVTHLKKGEMTTDPVQSPLGWHLILLEDSRPVQLLSLEQAKPQLEQRVRQQILAEYQESLRKAAKVQ